MTEVPGGYAIAILVVSGILLSCALFRSAMSSVRVPSMVAFLLLGIGLAQLSPDLPTRLQHAQEIVALFSPFFCVWIGTNVSAGQAIDALGLAALLLIVPVAGKVVGEALAARPLVGTRNAVLIGISMIPCAEIALIIMGYGHALGSWAAPDSLLSGMVLVAPATAILTPVILAPILAREAERQPTKS